MTVQTFPAHSHAFEPYHRYDLAALAGDMSEEEYFAFDRRTPLKYQLIHGKVVQMPGSSPEHNMIQADMGRTIGNILEDTNSNCDIIGSNQKVYAAHRVIYYPDLMIVCGEPQFDNLHALRNPAAIFEVLSPSTERDDRTDKFTDYRRIKSLRHYALVEQDRVAVTHYEKLDNGLWAIRGTHTASDDALRLSLAGQEIVVPIARIYRRVFELPATP